jgi:hypothetical protein
MKTDLYTKSVLTLIAVALLWLCIQNAVSPRTVSAQGVLPQRVVIVGENGQPLNMQFGIPVSIINPQAVPVTITNEVAAKVETKTQKWEYAWFNCWDSKDPNIHIGNEFSRFGDDGWELVTALTNPLNATFEFSGAKIGSGTGILGTNTLKDRNCIGYFKRPK